jgi:hypothetical protein
MDEQGCIADLVGYRPGVRDVLDGTVASASDRGCRHRGVLAMPLRALLAEGPVRAHVMEPIEQSTQNSVARPRRVSSMFTKRGPLVGLKQPEDRSTGSTRLPPL